MQKAFIAIALALTLSCVASYSTNSAGWVKTPVKVIEDTDINFTNSTRTLSLGSLTSLTDLNLLGYKQPVSEDGCPKDSLTSCDFALSYKPVATKDLSAKTNGSYGFKASDESSFSNGYAFEAFRANDSSSIPQIVLAQTKLEGGSVLPQITLTSNTKAEVKPSIPASIRSGKTVMVLVRYNQTINFTSYTIGGSSKGKEFQFLANTNITSFSLAWGEALSSSQAYLGYKDGDAYKVVVLDFGSGTQIGAGSLASYDKNMDCSPYATDKKLYGAVCTNVTTSDDKKSKNITVFTTSANTTLAPLFTVVNAASGYQVAGGIPYSGYLGFFHINATNVSAVTLDKQIWDLSTGKTFANQTNVLTYDSAADKLLTYRIPGAGIYAALYNQNATSNRTNIQLGQIMAGSSLTTVFGFLMTIVAGLFLF